MVRVEILGKEFLRIKEHRLGYLRNAVTLLHFNAHGNIAVPAFLVESGRRVVAADIVGFLRLPIKCHRRESAASPP